VPRSGERYAAHLSRPRHHPCPRISLRKLHSWWPTAPRLSHGAGMRRGLGVTACSLSPNAVSTSTYVTRSPSQSCTAENSIDQYLWDVHFTLCHRRVLIGSLKKNHHLIHLLPQPSLRPDFHLHCFFYRTKQLPLPFLCPLERLSLYSPLHFQPTSSSKVPIFHPIGPSYFWISCESPFCPRVLSDQSSSFRYRS